MGLGWSVHKNCGWRGQYERLRRWHRLVHRIGWAKTETIDTEQEHVFVYAYFQNCYDLRDWLRHAGAVASEKLQEFFSRNEPMGVCRDICNGTKHWRIDRPSVEAHFSIGRECVPATWLVRGHTIEASRKGFPTTKIRKKRWFASRRGKSTG